MDYLTSSIGIGIGNSISNSMKTIDTNVPSLIEPGVRYFIGGTLKECCKFKDRYINVFFNIGITILFIVLLTIFLLYRYKGNLTPGEIELKNREKQEYIVSKLQQLAYKKKQDNYNETMITDLPVWDNV
jgi:hypothetical protein